MYHNKFFYCFRRAALTPPGPEEQWLSVSPRPGKYVNLSQQFEQSNRQYSNTYLKTSPLDHKQPARGSYN